MPGFIEKASNRWSFHKVDESHCLVRFDAEIVISRYLKWIAPLIKPLMVKMMDADLRKFQEELQFRIAEGKPHPRKIKK